MFWSAGIVWSFICTLIVGSLVYLYLHLQKMQNYWPSRGFHFVSAKEIGGLIRNLVKGENIIVMDTKLYTMMKNRPEPCAGYLEFANPAVFISDLDLMRNIFIKDFDHFVNRRDFKAKMLDPLADKMLFFMDGDDWKELRTKVSPTFTTGKIRRMFDIIDKCGQRLVDFLHGELEKSNTVNFAEGYGKYTVDVIATAAFGIESGAFQQKSSIFEKMAEKLQFHMKLKNAFKFLTIFIAPKLAEVLKITLFDPEPSIFFSGTIKNVIEHRKQSGEKRDDFLQLMLEASSGQLRMDETSEELDTFEREAIVIQGKDKPKFELTDDVICAQSVLFFLAGFDTTQSALQFAVYQLAVVPDAQLKLAKEVAQSWKSNGEKFTYDSVNQMEYLDKFVSETLRMYPPVPRLERRCTKEYIVPGTKLVIPAGTLTAISSYAVHHDEEIYPDPHRFDPERFSKEAKAQRSPHTYLPFGHGPRNCIGMRFALTEVKLGIAHLVRNFVFEPCEKTLIPMKFAKSTSLKPDGGMWIKLSPRK